MGKACASQTEGTHIWIQSTHRKLVLVLSYSSRAVARDGAIAGPHGQVRLSSGHAPGAGAGRGPGSKLKRGAMPGVDL